MLTGIRWMDRISHEATASVSHVAIMRVGQRFLRTPGRIGSDSLVGRELYNITQKFCSRLSVAVSLTGVGWASLADFGGVTRKLKQNSPTRPIRLDR